MERSPAISDDVSLRSESVILQQGSNPSRTPAFSCASSPIRTCAIATVTTGLIALALAFVLPDYRLFQGTMLMAYAVSLLGLNLLTGYNGQFSLGHGAFFAIGAYTVAILVDRYELSFVLSLLAAGVLCFVVGYLFGFPALRFEALYLALATFSLALALPQLLKARPFEGLTGGVQGVALIKPDAPFGWQLTADQWLYCCAVVLTAVMFLIAAALVHSAVGRALIAIKDHPAAAEAMGVNINRHKAITFGISALYTGVGGGLSALAVQFVAPDSFTAFLSISLVIGIVVGGVGTLSGALYGAVFLVFTPVLTDSISKNAPWVVYGVVLIAVIFLMPAGIAGGLHNLISKYRASKDAARN
ncbi:branched-chain amino acid ABC transporter permease [Hydrogenophaga sp. YM1]|uniref:branched-chain amino acid ABC transporter permease n=1 Tax=Hydrogenophaga sp. YM1 TaxID=2806262 RepID=UPI00195B1FA0|nr:branched-chain amino acid ABC transporter permease [Hydrogenophaga sp. YM1]QRR33979.1 branched-chain amino acid ABC transporter permease [Hydrogenophaga sp. YM1]